MMTTHKQALNRCIQPDCKRWEREHVTSHGKSSKEHLVSQILVRTIKSHFFFLLCDFILLVQFCLIRALTAVSD